MSAGRRRLWVVWGLLLALVVAAFLLREGEEADDGHGHAGENEPVDARWLLPAPMDELGAVEVVHEGSLHRFERDAGGLWFYHGVHGNSDPQHGHVPDAALAAKIDTALAGFGRTRMERRIPVSEGPENYGVVTPQMIVLVYAKGQDQPLAQYAVGDRAPDTVSRYVMRVGDKEIVTIPNFQIENLVDLVRLMADASKQAEATPGGG